VSAGPTDFSVRELDHPSAVNAAESVVAIYRDVYSKPPYDEPETQVQQFAASWPARVSKPGFLVVGAEDPQRQLVGFAYGWTSVRGDTWNTRLMAELGAAGEEWLADCFEFVDLAVSSSLQGVGLGRRLTQELFARVDAATAILLTHQSTTTASQMYVRNGWVVLKDGFEVAPGKRYSIMGKKLTARRDAPAGT
jgi:ribosomal protein S18 acetylase RimI-like enzyme